MPGIDPEIVRLKLELPKRLMPELETLIGEFTVAHGIPVTVDDEPATLVNYNVDLTSPVLERDSETGELTGNQVRAITSEDLRTFAMIAGQSSNIGAMTFNRASAGLGYLGHTDCLIAVDRKDRHYDWLHVVIRPDKASKIAELLQNDLVFQAELTENQRLVLGSYLTALLSPADVV